MVRKILFVILLISVSFSFRSNALSILTANFGATTSRSGVASLVVTFKDSSIEIGSHIWKYHYDANSAHPNLAGDTGTVVSSNPNASFLHNYTSSGVYSVKIVVYDSSGNVDSITKTNYVTVTPNPLFTGTPLSGYAPLVVSFSNQSTGGHYSKFRWQFDTTNAADTITRFSTATFNHTYSLSGVYSVKLKGFDSVLGDSVSLTKVLYDTVRPLAKCTVTPQNGCATPGHPLTIHFVDGSTGGHFRRYYYNFDTTHHNDTSNVASPFHIYTIAGTYTIKHVVYDSLGNRDSVYKTVSVTGAPAVNFYTPDTIHLCAPHTVTFTNTSDTSAGCTLSFTWTIDTATGVNAIHTTHLGQTVSYTFTRPGDYDIALQESESCNCGPVIFVKHSYIHIDSLSVPCFSTPDTAGCGEPFTANFTNCTTNGASYFWDFGDGTTDTSANPSHIYGATNTTGYTDSLTSYTIGGCPTSFVKTHYVKVGHFNPGFQTYLSPTPTVSTTIICIGTSLNLKDTTFGATNHHWRFSPTANDTVNTTVTTISHSWTTSGIFTVSDSSWNTTGCSGVMTHTIFVAPNPTVDSITANRPFRCGPPDSVIYTSHIRDTTTYTVVWHFGEPGLGALDTAYSDSMHIYTNYGKYTPSIKVTDAYGCITNTSFSNFINVNPPFAAIKVINDSGCRAVPVIYSDTISENGIVLYDSVDYYIDSVAYSDGSATDTGSNITGSHLYTSAGRYMMYNYYHLDTSLGGCSFVDSILVSRGDTPSLFNPVNALVFSTIDSICPQDTVHLSDSCHNCSSVLWNVAGRLFHVMDTFVNFGGSSTGIKFVTYIANYYGCTDTLKNDSIYVWPPNIGFTPSIPGAGCTVAVPDSFLFTNTSTPPAGYVFHYIWDFGDGSARVTNTGTTPGALVNPIHKYSAIGTYSVTLIDSSISPNPHSCSNSLTIPVFVYPVARSLTDTDFYASSTLTCKNSIITFRGYFTQFDSLYKKYTWEWGDGTTSVSTTTDTFNHFYSFTGTYTTKLLLTTKYNCIDSITRTNYVTIEAPSKKVSVNGSVTTATVPVTGCTYFTVHFHDSATAFPTTTLTKRRWLFNATPSVSGAGTPPTTYIAGTVAQTDTTIIYPQGLYHIYVVDTDNLGCFSIDTVQINSVKPHAYFTSNDTVACTHVAIHFHDTTTHASYNWIFGDNSGLITSHSTDTSHVYYANGTYSDTLITITDGTGVLPSGCRDTLVRANYVVIGNTSVHANFNFSGISFATCPPLLVHTLNTSTSTGTNHYLWRFGVDSLITSTTTNPFYEYTYPGTYTVTLIDTTTLGCKDTIRNTVSIGGPTGTLTISPDTICANQSVLLHITSASLTPGVDTPFIWSVGYGVYSTDTSGFVATYATAGTYHPYGIIYQSSSSCSVTIYATDSVRVSPLPVIVLPNDSICKYSSVTITATGANTYSWSPSYGLSSTTRANPVASPTVTTTYTVVGTTNHGCRDSANTTVTVNSTPTSIGGTLAICNFDSTTLTNGTLGGTWSSQNTSIATISSTGVVTGVSAGTDTIAYTIGSCTATAIITVNIQPAAISGATSICDFATTTLADAIAGGIWSSTNTVVATVTGGTVTAHAVGSATISYTKGSCAATVVVSVNRQPDAISGVNSICNFATTSLSDDSTGGTWSSTATAIATVNSTGAVTGVNPGIATISYTIGSCFVTNTVTVHTQPDAISGGATSICNLSATTLVNDTTGGLWSSVTPTVATITTGGVVTGHTVGTSVISYTIGSCTSTIVVTVNPQPAVIAGGVSAICNFATTTFTEDSLSGAWSSATPSVATVSGSGVVTGVSPGTSIISYTIGSCSTTKTITINIQPDAISGTFSICNLSSTTLTDDTASGTWSSGTTSVATITGGGVVTGHAVGTSVITYTVGSCKSTAVMAINTQPVAIGGGFASICNYASSTLTDATTGGTWSSVTPGVATVSTTGTVTGVSPGTSLISYTIGSCVANKTVTINIQPDTISGVFSICNLSSTTLTNDTAAGTWSSGTTSVATITGGGVVTGHSVGTSVITYTVGSCKSTAVMTINTQPVAIGGSASVCNYASSTLTDATMGGTWSSVTPGVATVNSTGTVTGVTPGTSVISYTIGSCVATKTVTINIQPGAISGTFSICDLSSTTLTDDTASGTWSSGTTSVATITSGGVVTGHAVGTSVITYTVGSCKSTAVMTVNTQPNGISGVASVCNLSSTILTDDTVGGTWVSADPTVATISLGGMVTGHAVGTSVISYSVGSCFVTGIVTVNIQPDAISGILSICDFSSTTLTNDTASGAWSSGTTSVATITSSGVVTGVSVGTSAITYSVGSCRSTAVMTINTQPVAIGGGPAAICNLVSSTLTDATSGGTWGSVSPGVATVNSTGTVTGVTPGTSVISYTIGSCFATETVTINIQPDGISGVVSICNFSTTSLSDDTVGGTWSSTTPLVATITGSGVVTGHAVGTSVISYTVGSCAVTKTVTVNTQPDAITGVAAICNLSTTTLTNDTVSGTWSSGTTSVATVTSGGVVTGHSVGTSAITYTVGSCTSTIIVTVNIQPDAISGVATLCNFATTTLTDDTAAGTWSSVSPGVATVSSTGTVTGVTPGTSVISYAIGSCIATKTVTINIQPDAISGALSICDLSSTTLTDDTASGTWSSGTTSVATITTGGVVTGHSVGTSVITYTVGSCKSTTVMTINTQPIAIGGSASICNYASSTLTDATTGGSWSSVTPGVATVSSTGTVTGVTPGTSVISYAIGSCVATKTVTINIQPDAISGALSICDHSSTTLINDTASGIWSSGTTSVATITTGGVVTGHAVGTSVITYTVGSCKSTAVITINTQPVAIGGSASICNYASSTLTDATSGGSWSSLSPGVATVSSTGTVTGVTPGTSVISYTIGSCVVTKTVTINIQPDAISGALSICDLSSTTLIDDTTSGTWSSGTTSVATITTGGVVTGHAIGTSVITYTVGSCKSTAVMTINTQPVAIGGSAYICNYASGTLTDATSGGTWSSVTPGVATVSSTGTVTGVTPGTSVISYAIGSCIATKTVTINIQPGAISGTFSICNLSSTTLIDDTASGTWSSGTTTVATITTGGVVTGNTVGTSVITYTVGSCKSTAVITINTQPVAIGGSASICNYASSTLMDATTGGTWSSVTPGVATVSSTGTVTGVTPGTSVISYAIGSCVATKTVTINIQPDAISGTLSICDLSSTTLTDDTASGTWSSGTTTVATITTGGVVTGNTVGTSVITYTIGSCKSTAVMTINTQPVAIGGSASICNYASNTLTDATTGGTWSSVTPGVATVSSTGTVTGVTPGTSVISYTIGSCVATKTVTINIQPDAISGIASICNLSTTSFTDDTASGVWSSITPSVATVSIGGVVTGHAVGMSVISYTVGSCAVTRTVTVNTQPDAISGTLSICNLSSATLTNDTAAGTWSSGTASVATVASGGVVTGHSVGISVITYSVGSCRSIATVTVNIQPDVISGAASICNFSTTSLTDDTASGVWSSVTPAVATISVGGVVTGHSVGTSVISYTVGGCAATRTVTVHILPGAISGVAAICNLSSTTLTNDTASGTWSSGTTSVATVTSSGVVTGHLVGTSTITYTVGSCTSTIIVTVNIQPDAISGITSLCDFATTTLTDDTAGGMWSSVSSAVASISSSGVVTGITPGTSLISYTVGNCVATKTVTVNIQPAAITGITDICSGSHQTLSDVTPGGNWSSSATSIASVTGAGTSASVVGLSAGISFISYTKGSCYVSTLVTIHTQPGPVIGALNICNHATTNLSDDTLGGVWYSFDPSIAIVNSTGGTVTGISAGSTTITYKYDNCISAVTVTVNIQPGAILGPTNICTGTLDTLTDSVNGGSWSSSTTSVASVSSFGTHSCRVNTVSSGTTIITYSISNATGNCFSTLPVVVNIQPATISGNTAPICNYSSLHLTDIVPYGKWTSDNVSVAMIDSVTGILVDSSVGIANITYSLGNCIATTTITVDPQPAPVLGGDTSICNLSNILLSEDSAGGTWGSLTPGIATVNTAGLVSTHSAGIAVISYSILRSGGSCAATTTITVNMQPSPLTGGNIAICKYASTTLSDAIPGGTWLIDSSVVTQDSIKTDTIVITGISVKSATIITYKIGICTSSANITVNTQPSPIFGSPDSLCKLSTVTLTNDSAGGTWTSSNPLVATANVVHIDSAVVRGVLSGIISPDTATIYYTVGNCRSSVLITVNPLPVLSARDTTSCKFASVSLNINGADSYSWTPATGLSCSSCANPIAITPVVTTVYTITGASVHGCSSKIMLKDSVDNMIPLVFSGRDTICHGEIDTLTASGAPGVLWYPATGLSCNNCPVTHAQPDSTIVYTLVGTDLLGCHDTSLHTVAVTQLAHLTSTLTPPSICSGTPFHYRDTSSIPGASPSWYRKQVPGITPATNQGTGNISETLYNSGQKKDTVNYIYRLSYEGCTDSQKVSLVVESYPSAPKITSTPPVTLCNNTLYQVFSASTSEPTGVQYAWSADNATIWATGVNKQNCVVNFNGPGTSIIFLTANIIGSTCYNSDSVKLEIISKEAYSVGVVYDNYNFVCLLYTAESYQWGYDDAITLEPTTLTGQINQNYFNNAPDWSSKYYWVKTTSNGCMQKSYYNAPTGIVNVGNSQSPKIKVYPNPANDRINVEINGYSFGGFYVNIYDVSGKLMRSLPGEAKMEIDISNLSDGFYFIGCYENGILSASEKFIKIGGLK